MCVCVWRVGVHGHCLYDVRLRTCVCTHACTHSKTHRPQPLPPLWQGPLAHHVAAMGVHCTCSGSLEYSLTHSLTRSLTHSLTRSLTHSLLVFITGRRHCRHCGKGYNVATIDVPAIDGHPRVYMPPLPAPPECEPHLETRADDTEEVVRRRLQVGGHACTHREGSGCHTADLNHTLGVSLPPEYGLLGEGPAALLSSVCSPPRRC